MNISAFLNPRCLYLFVFLDKNHQKNINCQLVNAVLLGM